ncbi:hypothetical protein ILYODFUR_034279 [Ilyodon furcidens]|uniref:Uncharacterized protein n=1 Tax=Ilyodon furcidens TaxID=33524 RepID=A0ABV0SUK5_9TELE
MDIRKLSSAIVNVHVLNTLSCTQQSLRPTWLCSHSASYIVRLLRDLFQKRPTLPVTDPTRGKKTTLDYRPHATCKLSHQSSVELFFTKCCHTSNIFTTGVDPPIAPPAS